MADFNKWISRMEEEYGRATIEDQDYLVIYEKVKTDENGEEVLTVRNRIRTEDLREMFGNVIEEADSLDEIYAEDLEEVAGENPEADDDFHRINWEYDFIIGNWVDKGLVARRLE